MRENLPSAIEQQRAIQAALEFALKHRKNAESGLAGVSDLPSPESLERVAKAWREASDPEVQVVMRGGLVRCGYSTHPFLLRSALESIDFDVEGLEPGTVALPVDGGEPEDCLVNGVVILEPEYTLQNY